MSQQVSELGQRAPRRFQRSRQTNRGRSGRVPLLEPKLPETDQRTPDIASVIQEIVNRPGWSSGNSLVVIITGTGERTAESYNGDQAGAPLLRVEYTSGN